MSRGLIVYYSRSGHTQRVAQALAAASGWELEPVVDMRRRQGVVGYARSSLEATLARMTPIMPPRRDPRDYDAVVLGTPVWNAAVSSPIRTWLEQHRAALSVVAFFATSGGSGAARAFAQMAVLAGADPVATLVVRDRELDAGLPGALLRRLVADIDAAVAHPPAPSPP